MAVLNYAPEPRTPLDCPHCGNRAMSAVAKMWLGPARSVKCACCGQRVSVHVGRATLVLLSGLAPLLAFNLLHSGMREVAIAPGWLFAAAIVAFLMGVVTMFWLYVKFVPLVKR